MSDCSDQLFLPSARYSADKKILYRPVTQMYPAACVYKHKRDFDNTGKTSRNIPQRSLLRNIRLRRRPRKQAQLRMTLTDSELPRREGVISGEAGRQTDVAPCALRSRFMLCSRSTLASITTSVPHPSPTVTSRSVCNQFRRRSFLRNASLQKPHNLRRAPKSRTWIYLTAVVAFDDVHDIRSYSRCRSTNSATTTL